MAWGGSTVLIVVLIASGLALLLVGGETMVRGGCGRGRAAWRLTVGGRPDGGRVWHLHARTGDVVAGRARRLARNCRRQCGGLQHRQHPSHPRADGDRVANGRRAPCVFSAMGRSCSPQLCCPAHSSSADQLGGWPAPSWCWRWRCISRSHFSATGGPTPPDGGGPGRRRYGGGATCWPGTDAPWPCASLRVWRHCADGSWRPASGGWRH